MDGGGLIKAYNRNGRRNAYGYASLLVVLEFSSTVKANFEVETEISNNQYMQRLEFSFSPSVDRETDRCTDTGRQLVPRLRIACAVKIKDSF